jgi:putative transposase
VQEISLDFRRSSVQNFKPSKKLIHDTLIRYSDWSRVSEVKTDPEHFNHEGDCWDNAAAESFFATIKRELVRKCYWMDLKAARMAIHEYIDVFYNRRRRHSTNGNLSPVEYERRFINHAAVAA